MLELFVSDVTTLHATGFAVAFVLTVLLISLLKRFLPRDHGRKFAVEGQLSNGKERGAGIIFVSVFVFTAVLFTPQKTEGAVYLLAVLLAMVAGYLDDASEIPWKDYKKAIIDLLIAVMVTFVYIFENGTTVKLALTGISFTMPTAVFALCSVILIWISINVTNCTDGVDGLSASLGIATLMSFAVLIVILKGNFSDAYVCLLFSVCLMGYLLFNANPSTVLMGDAGSRAMGTLIAIIALKSGTPFMWIPLAIVFIVDGGVGLVKLFLARFFKIKILKNVRTPLHDHVRKNLNWSNTQTVYRYTIIQVMISAMFLWMAR